MNLVFLGDEHLTKMSKPVEVFDEKLKELTDEMLVLMKKSDGVGLAAPQVGINIRLFVIRIDDGVDRVFVNPQIIETSQEQCVIEEGCLSIPKFYAKVQRPSAITVQFFDLNGKPHTIQASGFLARVIQHENDHLNGVLFIDRIPEEKRRLAEKMIKKRMKA
ncbi:MAG: peptide deformylase [Treponema sp.]|nr:MAG: peptide deformylase [Treponema sp.]